MRHTEKVRFYETHWKKFNSMRHIEKSSILWDTLEKKFNSMRHIGKKVQFCESLTKKSLINFEIEVQFLESNGGKKVFNSLSRLKKKVQFCESFQSIQFLESV